MLTFKNYNIADWFSFYRIVVAPFLLVLLWLNEREIFTWLLLVNYSTDIIDGYLARRLEITSPRGSQLDSFGDQVTLIVGLLGLWIFENDFIRRYFVLIAISFVPYIIQMIMAYIKYGKATAFHTYLAKFSAFVQGGFILSSLFFFPCVPLFYAMIIIGLLETAEEIYLVVINDHWMSDIKGIYWVYRNKHQRRQRSNNQK